VDVQNIQEVKLYVNLHLLKMFKFQIGVVKQHLSDHVSQHTDVTQAVATSAMRNLTIRSY